MYKSEGGSSGRKNENLNVASSFCLHINRNLYEKYVVEGKNAMPKMSAAF